MPPDGNTANHVHSHSEAPAEAKNLPAEVANLPRLIETRQSGIHGLGTFTTQKLEKGQVNSTHSRLLTAHLV